MLFSTNTAGVFEKAESPETTEKEVRMEQEKVQRPLQWHPAFYADLQIELEVVKDNLICENEQNDDYTCVQQISQKAAAVFAERKRFGDSENRRRNLLYQWIGYSRSADIASPVKPKEKFMAAEHRRQTVRVAGSGGTDSGI